MNSDKTITPGDVRGDLAQVLAEELPGRCSDREITLFDTTGMGTPFAFFR